jgi:carboxypeptidase C (cathepsin A)
MLRRRQGLAFVLAAALGGAPAAAQRMDPVPALAGPLLGPVDSAHRIAIGGVETPYRAQFREYPLADDDGRPLATISATAYLRADVAHPASRPIVFFFNGGPGASSSPLHFQAFGPRLRGEGDAPFFDNPHSPLDVADLVFVDPVGTGFSRVLPGGDGARYWAPLGDAGAVLSLIRRWLADHGRAGSPLFIAGESYGGFRLATMMRDADDLNLEGLMFISPMFDASGLAGADNEDLGHVFRLPSMAIAAWHHGAVDRRGLTAEAFFEEAARFAESDYLVALHQGSALPRADRNRIAARMAAYIGLPAERILAADLRIGNDVFVRELLRDRGLLAGRLDSRVTAPVRPPERADRPAAANDPSLGLGATNVIRSAPIAAYMRDELLVSSDRDYVSLTLDVNFRWNWAEPVRDRTAYYNPLRNVAAVMAARPSLRMMVVGGLYDLATPVTAARHAVRHGAIPPERVTFLILPAGHSPFDTEEMRRRFSEGLRAFVRGDG